MNENLIKRGTVISVRVDSETCIIGEFLGTVEVEGVIHFALAFPVELKTKIVPVPVGIQVPRGMTPETSETIQPLKLVHSGTTIPVVSVINIPIGKYPFGIIAEGSSDYEMYKNAKKIISGDDGVEKEETEDGNKGAVA